MADAKVDVTVVIPSRDRPALLERCLERVEAAVSHAGCRTQIVVVDDGSEPPLDLAHHPLVEVVRGNGEGPSVARDRALGRAIGDVVAFTDDDALVDVGWLAAALSALAGDPAMVGVRGPVVSPPFDPLFEHSVDDADGGRFLTCNVAYRRTPLLESGGFDPGFRHAHEDVDLGLRMEELGTVGFAKGMVVVHPGRPFTAREWDRRTHFMLDDWLAFRRHPVLLAGRGPVRSAPLRIALRSWAHRARIADPPLWRSPSRATRWARLAAGQVAGISWLSLTRARGHLTRPVEPRTGLRIDGLRIAYVGPVPGRDLGGAPGVEGALIEQLVRRGCSVDCYVPTSEHFNSASQIASLEGVRVIEGRSSFRFGRWYSNNPLTKMVSFQLFQALSRRRLAAVVAAEHEMDPYDVLYQCSSIESFGVPRLVDLPVAIHPSVHAAGELRWLRSEAALARRCQGRLRSWMVRTWMAARSRRQRHDIRRVDEVLALSRSFADLLVEDYDIERARTCVVPNCIDPERFTLGADVEHEGPVTILVLGRVVVRKGIEDVVALSHRLTDLEGQVELVVVGGGSLWSDYRPLLDDLAPGVSRVIGGVGFDEVAALLGSSRLLLQLSRYEPFGLTVAEALACGVPAIATSAVGAAEGISSDVVQLVEPGAIDDLEAVVRAELARGPLSHARRERCRQEALARYAPAVVADELLARLTEVATRPR